MTVAAGGTFAPGSLFHAEALHPFGVILAVDDVPFLAAFEDFLFLGADLGADFGVHLLFELQERGKNIDDFVADGVAVLDEVDVRAGDQKIENFMREANGFFAAESNISGE